VTFRTRVDRTATLSQKAKKKFTVGMAAEVDVGTANDLSIVSAETFFILTSKSLPYVSWCALNSQRS
jgi:hypothetical protein